MKTKLVLVEIEVPEGPYCFVPEYETDTLFFCQFLVQRGTYCNCSVRMAGHNRSLNYDNEGRVPKPTRCLHAPRTETTPP